MSKIIIILVFIFFVITIFNCENPTKNKHIEQKKSKLIRFLLDSTELIIEDTVGNVIIDTFHVSNPESNKIYFSILGYSKEGYSTPYESPPDGMNINDSIISWNPSHSQGGIYRIQISVIDIFGNADTCIWTLKILSLKVYSKESWKPWDKMKSRYCHTVLSFQNKIWLIGGVELSDVWSSIDGINWVCTTPSAEFGKRHYHSSIVFDNKMWVLAGYPGKSDIWYSVNGENWVCTQNPAPFGSRSGHTTVVFKNGLYLIGGYNNIAWYDKNVEFYNDVWYSKDGINWEVICSSAPFTGRTYHASTVFNGRIWVIGGNDGINDLNDCWSSIDGITWEKVFNSAKFTPRRYHSVLCYKSALWLFSGFSMSNHGTKNILHSYDGKSWRNLGGYISYSHASIVHQDTMWILGGYNSANNTFYSIGFE